MRVYLGLILVSFMVGCIEPQPNLNTYSEKVIEENNVSQAEILAHEFVDTTYVPIYSDIYNRSANERFYLTATLSVRNTSYRDTMIIRKIDYFNTTGELVEEYLESPIYLNPMGSIDYVIDEEDKKGGSGANFIVIWSANNIKFKPVIQAVMISTSGPQGVAFTTDGVSTNN
ncbi:MAG: DUF3124 domain-containing protein [Flavobacteriales bacterium]|nr:DUF3124 domain-containing protein [Flavobacteriales bacterium]